MKILFNYIDYNHSPERKRLNHYGGVGYYRLIQPARALQKYSKNDVDIMGKEAVLFGDSLSNWDEVFKKYDVLWLASVYGEQNMSAIYYWAQHHKKKVIMDVDDNYLDLAENHPMYAEFARGKKQRALFSASISLADVVTVSTEPLRDRLRDHFKKVYNLDKKFIVSPNMNTLEDWKFPAIERPKDKFIIGYAGSNSHQNDLVMVMPSIAKIMKKHPHVHLELMGSVPKDKIKEYFGGAGFDDDALGRISLVTSTDSFNTYPEHLAKQPWHLGICPLVDTPFTRSKSHIKWMEYSMYKIPTIASRVYPYFMDIGERQTIQHGETGYLCREHEWFDTLDDVIEHYEERKIVGENAYNFIKEHWQWDKKQVEQVLEEALK
jgi:glycosyltransferase involved in cell wall biosynthesis